MIIFLTDQHHMNDLERKVIERFASEESVHIRLMGDFSIHQMNPKKKSGESSVLKKIQSDFKKEKSITLSELTFDLKIQAHEWGINQLSEEEFYQLVALYGGGLIANLARKLFIDNFSQNPVLCLEGNEPLMAHAQNIIYERLDKMGFSGYHLAFGKILDTVKQRMPIMYSMILKQLKDVKAISVKALDNDVDKYLRKMLNPRNYGGDMPTSMGVFSGAPHLSNFQFLRDVTVETFSKCIIVYVPYMSGQQRLYEAVESARKTLPNELSKVSGLKYVVAYHGNPCPELMISDDEKTKKRIDYNLPLIELVLSSIFDSKNYQRRKVSKTIDLLCGHLHVSCCSKPWDRGHDRLVQPYPLGITDFISLNENTGEIRKESYLISDSNLEEKTD